jgi:hypothetical protein
MLRRRTVVSLCAVLLLSLAAPTVALAQEEPDVISSVTIVDATVDTHTGVATVTVSVTCLMPAAVVRGEVFTFTQRYGSGRYALSSGYTGSSSCQAGQVLTFPIRLFPFVPYVDRFVPGPAEIHGYMEAGICCVYPSDDTESIGPTTVILRPA